MLIVQCLACGQDIQTQRTTRKFCSQRCNIRYRNGYPKTRHCLECGTAFQILTQRADANRKYCSYNCSKRANGKRIKQWVGDHPDAVTIYRKRRLEKYPGMWREKARAGRLEAIKLLGAACVVCGITNTNWLHIDYIPTTRGKNTRHARHIAYVRSHLNDFRLLCANHHYELTLTGAIEGTDITQ